MDLNLGGWLRQNRDVLDEVLELAHVSAPRAGDEEVERLLTEFGNRILCRAMAGPVCAQKMIGEQGNVFGSIAQRRDGDLHDVQPVIEILAQKLAAD